MLFCFIKAFTIHSHKNKTKIHWPLHVFAIEEPFDFTNNLFDMRISAHTDIKLFIVSFHKSGLMT